MNAGVEHLSDFKIFLDACHRLGWLNPGLAWPTLAKDDSCLLQFLVENTCQPELKSKLRQAIQYGFTLRTSRTFDFDSDHADHVSPWIGKRWIGAHLRAIAEPTRWTAIACSRLGREYRNLPEWPRLVDHILKWNYREGNCLLLHPQTTLSQELATIGRAVDLPILHIKPSKGSIEKWLRGIVASFSDPSPSEFNTLALSPGFGTPTELLGPEQDRVLCGLAQRLYCLWLRPKGNLEQLIESRLRQSSLCPASPRSTYIYVPNAHHPLNQQAQNWLSKGVIGFQVNSNDRDFTDASESKLPRACDRRSRPLWQLTLSATQFREQSNYFVHCTRGQAPPKKLASAHLDRWQKGFVAPPHPLIQLAKICEQRRLVSSAWLNRSHTSCVSFSSHPLQKLMQMRRFRSHLGRWDWEPYGLLIDRQTLLEMGVQPVIYGDEATYDRLDSCDRPYFQPVGKSNWSVEQEWRLKGDLDLSLLTSDKIRVFTRSRAEARWLSQTFDWPVLWVHDG